MTGIELFPILPLILLVLGGLAILLMEPFTASSNKSRMGQVAVLAVAVAAFSLSYQWTSQPQYYFGHMFLVDNFSVFFQWLFLVITGICAVVSMRFNEREEINRGEYYALLLFACCGMCLMAASADLILTFLGIEILSIATYILAGFKRNDRKSNESALKYFLLGSFATAFLLYGIALIYGTTGSSSYQTIRSVVELQGEVQGTTLIGMGLLLVGFGFKVALVPFHTWAPDVYEGAPTPITAFMTVGPKAAGFAALMRILAQVLPALDADWIMVLWVLSILTMTVGNVVAILQTNIKRMLAYSAIAHAGYILVGIVANSRPGFGAVVFYLVVYTIMNLGALTIILSLSRKGDARVYFDDYAGLGRSYPIAAGALALFLISLAGIPLTGGFMGKFYLFSAAVQEGFIGLAVVGVLNSVLSVYYYFRVLVVMYMRDPNDEEPVPALSLPILAVVLLALVGIIWFGVNPGQMMDLAINSVIALR